MDEQNTNRTPAPTGSPDAVDINDFVYAATGARVRRLTMPDGTHWFPAADVARELGHTNGREAVRRHVPEHMRRVAGTVISRDGLTVPAGQGIKKSMVMLSLNGLIRLVNGCVKPECEPFKNWVTEVVVAVQRDGSYSLGSAGKQPRQQRLPEGPPAYAMPREVADAIVRLEENNLRQDEEYAAHRSESIRVQRDIAAGMSRMADSLDRIAVGLGSDARPVPAVVPQPPATPEAPATPADAVLDAWRQRLVITDDVWAVAVYIVPGLAARGRTGYSPATIASRTGLTLERVHDCLRFLLKRQCIRQVGLTEDGAPVYVLSHP